MNVGHEVPEGTMAFKTLEELNEWLSLGRYVTHITFYDAEKYHAEYQYYVNTRCDYQNPLANVHSFMEYGSEVDADAEPLANLVWGIVDRFRIKVKDRKYLIKSNNTVRQMIYELMHIPKSTAIDLIAYFYVHSTSDSAVRKKSIDLWINLLEFYRGERVLNVYDETQLNS